MQRHSWSSAGLDQVVSNGLVTVHDPPHIVEGDDELVESARPENGAQVARAVTSVDAVLEAGDVGGEAHLGRVMADECVEVAGGAGDHAGPGSVCAGAG